MLKQRVITALVLVAILLIALFNENPILWQVFVSVAISVAFYEWLKFCRIESITHKILSFSLFIGLSFVLYSGLIPVMVVVIVLSFVWLVLFVFTFTDRLQILHEAWLKLLIGALVLAGSGWLIVEFKIVASGAWWILCFLMSVWAADVGAYFVGKRFGKTKLAPSISPGKTIEGLLGGLFLVLLVFTPVSFYFFNVSAALLLLLTIVFTALASVAGDLFESKLKRFVGLKDSGQILPGHGGVLDRIDSLLAGAPFFSVGLFALGYLR